MSIGILVLLGGAAVLTLALIVVGIVLMRRPKAVQQEPTLPSLDLDSLPTGEIPTEPRVEIYNIRMQWAAVVVAPAGRASELPELEQLTILFDDLSPGMSAAFIQHRPKLVLWPPQLSSEGFVRSFFRHVALPGNKGRGTPWCSLAGRVESSSDSVLVGIVCRSASANSLGQILVERPSKWLDILRIRTD